VSCVHGATRWRAGCGASSAGSLLVAALALAACADAAQARSAYCSPSGDYCTSVQRHGSDFHLRLGAFSFRGRYDLCVIAPDRTRRCRSFALRGRAHGIYGSGVHWSAHFPNRGRGLYRVRWSLSETKLGPGLLFRR